MNLKKVEEILEVIMVEGLHDSTKRYHTNKRNGDKKNSAIISNISSHNKKVFVFMDIPNITAYNAHAPRGFNLNSIEWGRFLKLFEVFGNNNETELICKLFVRPSEMERCAGALINAEDLGMIIIHGKTNKSRGDIDPQLSGDIVYEVARQQEGSNICLILMSGDGDYVYALNKAKLLAQLRNIDLKIIIISWQASLSGCLIRVADKIICMSDFMSEMNGGYNEY